MEKNAFQILFSSRLDFSCPKIAGVGTAPAQIDNNDIHPHYDQYSDCESICHHIRFL